MSSFFPSYTFESSYSVFGVDPVQFVGTSGSGSSGSGSSSVSPDLSNTLVNTVTKPLNELLKRVGKAYNLYGINPVALPYQGSGQVSCPSTCVTEEILTELLQSNVVNPLSTVLQQILQLVKNSQRPINWFFGKGMEASAAITTEIKDEYFRYLELYGEPDDWEFDETLLNKIREELQSTPSSSS